MKNQKPVNMIDEWLEQFDFNELNQKQKDRVLSVMSENEYNEIRKSLIITKDFFANSTPIVPDDRIRINLHHQIEDEGFIYRVLNYKMPLYQVAASFVVLLGLMFLFLTTNFSNKAHSLAIADTVFVDNFDTVLIAYYDTVEIVKEIHIKEKNKPLETNNEKHKALYNIDETSYLMASNRGIKPNDLDKILNYSKSNSLKNDKELAAFVNNR